jgi:hypothetical protein
LKEQDTININLRENKRKIMEKMKKIKSQAWQLETLEIEELLNNKDIVDKSYNICCFDFDEVNKILAFGLENKSENGLVNSFDFIIFYI